MDQSKGRDEAGKAQNRAPQGLLGQKPAQGVFRRAPCYLPSVWRPIPDELLAHPSDRPQQPLSVCWRVPAWDSILLGLAFPRPPPAAAPHWTCVCKVSTWHLNKEQGEPTEGDGRTLSHPCFRREWETDPWSGNDSNGSARCPVPCLHCNRCFQQPCTLRGVIPMLQMKKLKLREGQSSA